MSEFVTNGCAVMILGEGGRWVGWGKIVAFCVIGDVRSLVFVLCCPRIVVV